ncbi:2-aminoethanethiol dioxygenase-like [Salvelinus namaycush]|uniref:2-aminoethanethiol dioxygenase-like n=1 Tax=Salvelinus namaycush TaxID=8040 RepID=A0A8U0P0L8_SALNM|nr:2-aminoethanethiol dioxygenase-like [Salvelinus namaycush]
MLRDNMTSIVQKIARQALVTFRNPSSFGDKAFLGNQCKLQSLMTEIRAADLKIPPRKVDSASTPLPHNPPVTYMHICETDEFSMGVFLLKSGASIPLHDHPGMYGMLKVMYGKVRITCFDRLDKSSSVASDTQFNPPLLPFQRGALRRSILGSVGEFTEESGPCILTPDRNNLHQIDAVDGPTAFLDILAPPYDPDDGRDCHYYKVLQSAPDSEDKKADGQKEVWLMEVSQPSEFWCGGEPYPGPEVKI